MKCWKAITKMKGLSMAYISNTDPSELDSYHSVTYVVNDEDDWPPSIWMDDLDEWRPRTSLTIGFWQ